MINSQLESNNEVGTAGVVSWVCAEKRQCDSSTKRQALGRTYAHSYSA